MSAPTFAVTTLGTGAALPARGRFPTAQHIEVQGTQFLMDCGEGTQERMRIAGLNFMRISRIFISHLHGDHYLGLMGLISSMHLMGRMTELHVHGPSGLQEVIDVQLRVSGTFLRFPLRMHTVAHEHGVEIFRSDRLVVTTLALKHRVPCTGYVFRELKGDRLLRKETLSTIPIAQRAAVKQGKDMVLPDGSMLPNAHLTLESDPPRSYAFCSDTAYEPSLVPHLNDVDLLYHEATFTSAMAAKAKATMHSTAEQAAQIAAAAGVQKLLLGHFSSRFRSSDGLVAEAKAVFPATEASVDGARYLIPVRKDPR